MKTLLGLTLSGGLLAMAFAAGMTTPANAEPTRWRCIQGMCKSNQGDVRWRDSARGNHGGWDGPSGHGPSGWHDDRPHWKKYRRHHRRDNSGFFLQFNVVPRVYVEPRRRVLSVNAAHVEWCYDRWLSYREWDNTYQPSRGKRRQCISPFL